MMIQGIITPDEFMHVISRKLDRIEQQRMAAAGFQG
jgi:hypothetical protein